MGRGREQLLLVNLHWLTVIFFMSTNNCPGHERQKWCYHVGVTPPPLPCGCYPAPVTMWVLPRPRYHVGVTPPLPCGCYPAPITMWVLLPRYHVGVTPLLPCGCYSSVTMWVLLPRYHVGVTPPLPRGCYPIYNNIMNKYFAPKLCDC